MKLEGPREQIALGLRTLWIGDTDVDGAHVCTRRDFVEADALGAESRIDLVDGVTQADGRVGTRRQTGVARYALLGDQDRHRLPVLPPSLLSLSGIPHRVKPDIMESVLTQKGCRTGNLSMRC
jgi:hypothetical protein